MVNKETAGLENFLSGLRKLEKDIAKYSQNLTSDLGAGMENIIKKHMVAEEKKMKINKKPAKVSLLNDGSLHIVFENPEDGKKFYKGEK